jgi:hypothetical protein
MDGLGDGGRRRVFVPQALGADEFLRVTWHEGRRVLVFSHWEGDRCVAATPVRVSDIAELAELTVTALTRSLAVERPAWAPPCAGDVVEPAWSHLRPA